MGATGCVIWRMPCQRSQLDDPGHLAVYDSVRAGGDYKISLEAKNTVQGIDDKAKARLTTWLVDQHNAGVHMPVVTDDIVKAAKSSPPLGVEERANRLLAYLAQRYQHIGTPIGIELPPHDVSQLPPDMIPNPTRVLWECMAWSESTMLTEVEHLLKHLHENEWVRWDHHDPLVPDFVTVSVAGHQKHEAHQRRIARAVAESPWESPPSGIMADAMEVGEGPMVREAELNPTAFMSYSWDDEEHKSWVRELAGQLRSDGIDVKLDQWETAPGDQLTPFMESGVREHDFVVIVCTPQYKERSDARAGGVGYEGSIMTAEVLRDQNHRKFIPILRSGTWDAAAPSWLRGKYYIDLRGSPYGESAYQELLATLHGERPKPPPVGQRETRDVRVDRERSLPPRRASSRERASELGDIRIVEVIAGEVTEPRNDGTPGSALYTVPLRLSATPPSLWASLFVQHWDQPPRWTPMHRSGIARVVGNKVLLEGTTIEEVEMYHRDTLQAVLEVTNRDYRQLTEQQERERRARENEQAHHRRNVDDVARRINFE